MTQHGFITVLNGKVNTEELCRRGAASGRTLASLTNSRVALLGASFPLSETVNAPCPVSSKFTSSSCRFALPFSCGNCIFLWTGLVLLWSHGAGPGTSASLWERQGASAVC